MVLRYGLPLCALALAGCTAIVGLDGDYTIGEPNTSAGGAAAAGTSGPGGSNGGGPSSATGPGPSSGPGPGSGGVGGNGGSTGNGGAGGGPLGNWTRRRLLTLDLGANVSVSDFPVLVVITAASIDYAAVQSAGEDLRFTASDGTTLLAHEIELFQSGSTSVVWVGASQLGQSSNTKPVLWMYYGNASASDGQNAVQVWSPDFTAVWHLGQSLADASGNNPAATNVGTVITAGRIGDGRSFTEAQSQYIDTGYTQHLPQFTVEGWARGNHAPIDSGGINGIVMRQNNFQMVWDHIDNNFDAGISFRSSSSWNGADYGTLAASTWYYLAATYDGSTLRAYRNGVLVDSQGMGAPDAESNTAKIGRHAFENQANDHFDGLIDEVRIASVPRSTQWIAAQYRSMNGAGFVTFGAEEQGSWTLP